MILFVFVELRTAVTLYKIYDKLVPICMQKWLEIKETIYDLKVKGLFEKLKSQ